MKYVDADGNDLATSDTLNGKIDAPYQTSAKSISDWAVKTTPNNATGVFTNSKQTTSILSGSYGEKVTPVPIPNTVVKLLCANGSWGLPPARVGRCRAVFLEV